MAQVNRPLAGTRSAPPVLAQARTLIEPFLTSAIGRLSSELRLISGYHLGWHDSDGREVPKRAGKALRPSLVLLSGRAARAHPELALPVAAAVELVHNHSLLHDDVIDRDEYRRHRLTVWMVFGDAQAILAGDALLNLAYQLLAEHPSPHRTDALLMLTRATADLIEGQQADLSFEDRLDVTVDEYLKMAGDKTSALMSAAAALGATLAGADDSMVDGLASFGRHLGLAFQGVDDLLGTWGEPDVTGKPIASDLRRRKKTLPVAFTLSGQQPYCRQLREMLSRAVLTDSDVVRATELLEESGARQWVTDFVHRETNLALQALEGLPIPPRVRAEFRQIVEFVSDRSPRSRSTRP